MTNKPSSNETRLSLIAQAAQHSADQNPDSSIQAAADRAAELAQKAIKDHPFDALRVEQCPLSDYEHALSRIPVSSTAA